VGTWGPGAFDNDDALDLLDALTDRDAMQRRQELERIFRRTREHPEDLNYMFGHGQVVAAAAVVAAGRDGTWYEHWADPQTALQARRATDHLASIFYRHQHRDDEELPFDP
jgi:hypothetical protein